ncbi:carbon-nitrogen hydrolase family protein [Methanobacterium paludis]|uniref:Nitrilase/cyanide hydratase and apolipoprotein N-acyltransferase n=1 Tax=Methanobacterium paludis (strain DSM 25820 / JCM 18151 / SWAN1) TaxID=868131 RepID=F6D7W0_METPW|nr:carbon-nitrogen hydrolase family protein [Methanobacterium paludis]AEG17798.1 Nitrilase/cyanide hydratase and apolipoprotein N-acyltransferase [Methanobacterium paludis]
MKNHFKLAVCQMNVVDNKDLNLNKAVNMIESAARNKADMVLLPEMFNCPYDNSKFVEYAESRKNSRTLKSISSAAERAGIYVIAGSIPELENGKLYNSSFIFGRMGKIIGVHRKMHLFDIDVSGEITFKESETLTAGNEITVVDTELCKIGVAICYDIRFPELLRLMADKGAELIAVPGAFNMTTGPAHWEPLMKVRAADNQVYVAAASPARNESLSYVAYGNSMIVDPWGDIISRADADEKIIYADINLSKVESVRNELPLLKNRRKDIYEVCEK